MEQLRMKARVDAIGTHGVPQRREIATADRSVDGVGFHALGLSLAEGKAIQCRLQEELT
jgi:hypothetical protein